MTKGYRNRWSFRVLSWVLKINPTWATLFVGVIYLPFMLAGSFTVAFLAFCLALAFILWFSTIPRWRRTDDGVWYPMDSDERAEWIFDNRRFPKL